jgi:xanthine dehydrogenase accessory factor
MIVPMFIKILVRGSGDVGSAVAHALFNANYGVVIHDVEKPGATRRRMAFCDAIFDGDAVLSGVAARLIEDASDLPARLAVHDHVAVSTQDISRVLAVLQPEVLVDARMRKHDRPEIQTSLAPLTLGLGPNFIAGETVHAAVETGWNEDLGKVLWDGTTRPLEGEPQSIEGHARDRYVYAPAAGIFRTAHQIGDMVSVNQEIARINEIPLCAPIGGMLRGLTHDGVPVAKKAKIIEVDPRGKQAPISGIAERSRRIAGGVLQAIQAWEKRHTLVQNEPQLLC